MVSNDILQLFFSNIEKRSVLSKDDIYSALISLGVDVGRKKTKSDLISLAHTEDMAEKFYNIFAEKLYVPYWTAAKLFGLTSKQWNILVEDKYIEIPSRSAEFYFPESKVYKNVATYSYKSLETLDKDSLQSTYSNAYGGTCKIRVWSVIKENVEAMNKILNEICEIESTDIYEHNGYSSYYIARPLNCSAAEENKFIKQIHSLEKINEELRQENQRYKEMHIKLAGFIDGSLQTDIAANSISFPLLNIYNEITRIILPAKPSRDLLRLADKINKLLIDELKNKT